MLVNEPSSSSHQPFFPTDIPYMLMSNKSPSAAVTDVPELADLLASYLAPPDLLCCAQVSSRWNQNFIPHLWRTIDCTLYSWERILRACFNDAAETGLDEDWVRHIFAKYGQHIRHLSSQWSILIEAASTSGVCTNLISLEMTFPKTIYEAQQRKLKTDKHAAETFDNSVVQAEDVLRPDIRVELETEEGESAKPYSEPMLPIFADVFEEPTSFPHQANGIPATHERIEQGWISTQRYWSLILANPGLHRLHLSIAGAFLWKPRSTEFVRKVLVGLKELKELYIQELLNAKLFWQLGEIAPTVEAAAAHLNPLFGKEEEDGGQDGESEQRSTDGDNVTIGLPKPNPAIKSLRLTNNLRSQDFLTLLHLFPNLEKLTIGGFADGNDIGDSEISASTPLPPSSPSSSLSSPPGFRLQSLTVVSATGNGKQIASLVRVLPNLTEIRVEDLDKDLVEVLAAHCKCLEVVETTFNPWYVEDNGIRADHDPVNLLLASCPKLRVIDAITHFIHAEDIVQIPWVCHGLEKLRCRIVGVTRLNPEEQITYQRAKARLDQSEIDLSAEEQAAVAKRKQSCEQQRQVYDRLASLTRLKHVDLGYENRYPWTYKSADPYVSEVDGEEYLLYDDPTPDTLELSLESGLDRLSAWKSLEMFGFEAIDHRISKEELEWMAKSWPKLKLMYGLAPDNLYQIEFDKKKGALCDYMTELRPDVEHGSLFEDNV